jgi:hypothetical protein
MRIGADELLRKYKNPLKIAEALLLGKLDSSEQEYVDDLVSKIILEAAKFRIAHKKSRQIGSAKKEALKDLFKWWNDYGGKLPQKQYNILGEILERLVEE